MEEYLRSEKHATHVNKSTVPLDESGTKNKTWNFSAFPSLPPDSYPRRASIIGVPLSKILKVRCFGPERSSDLPRPFPSQKPLTILRYLQDFDYWERTSPKLSANMTPDKSKKPLPSSTSMIIPERPKTYQQWKVALQRVKILYLRSQWKQCSARCNQLLLEAKTPPHPLHATYLHFYDALSVEATARLIHDLSTAKFRTLEQARMSYKSAASSLPVAETIPGVEAVNEDRPRSACSSSHSEDSDDWGESVTSLDILNSPDSATPPSSTESNVFSTGRRTLKSTPLPIRKAVSFSQMQTIEVSNYEHNCGGPNMYPSKRHPYEPASTARPSAVTFSPSTSTWLDDRSYDRYNAYLASFAEMLANHISNVDTLIMGTYEAQTARYTIKGSASYGDDEETKAADLRARIARMKAGGWKRERFAPERYQELCAQALAEL